MHGLHFLAPFSLVVVAFAGCVDRGDLPDGAGSNAAPSAREEILSVLTGLPAPAFNPGDAVTHWEEFLLAYPKRDWLLPHNQGAAEYLSDTLAGYGFATEILTFPATAAAPAPLSAPVDVKVVRGVLEGADPAHRLALVAHYDTVTETAQGAYDDGAGTVAELEICQLLSKARPLLRHTIECLFFDAEERGLVASRAFTDWYRAHPDRGFEYDLVFGYDMTGINWPGHDWKLFAMIGTQHDDLAHLTAPFDDFLRVTLHEFLDPAVLPGAGTGIEVLQVHDRNSDEQSFKRIGIPVVRFAGGRHAADYPMYHQPLDTTLYVYQFVGGRANFEKGFGAAILASYYTILGFDAFDPQNLPTA